jgi:menaquinone-dependent protoporphyrinogen oxidase
VRILIVYGSRRDGTRGLAVLIAAALAERGLQTRVRLAGPLIELDEVDAVIVAGALYLGRWHRDAVRFVRHHARMLRRLPLWLVSSDTVEEISVGGHHQVRQVARLAASVGARGQVTFGGHARLDPHGPLAGAMVGALAGNDRDPAAVRHWAATVAAELAPNPV